WTPTHQKVFEQVWDMVHKWRDNRQVAQNYSDRAPAINLVTDVSLQFYPTELPH
ncbi:hypothetical protein K466DRAFT_505450, partial [Polyporus arcularius HHB13444]